MTSHETKRLLVDVDDCVCRFRHRYLELVNDMFGLSKTLEDGAEHYRCETAFGLNQEQEDQVYAEILKPGFALTLDIVPGAVEAIEELRAQYEVVFVTAPLKESPTWAHDRRAWIRKYFGKELEESSNSTSSKHMIDGDYLIEDNLENAHKWLIDRRARCDGHRPVEAILYSWGYNHTNVFGITRLASWEDIVRYLE